MVRERNQPVRILVVEDDPDVLSALNIALGLVGFDVDVMLHGKEILTNQFVLPDLFVIDKRLPDIDGLDLCKFLKSKQNYKGVPVIVISASEKTRKKALAVGASEFIAKPFAVGDLVNAINNTLQLNKSVD